MLKKLLGRAPVGVWVIKQVDDDLLHLCGRGIIDSGEKRRNVLAALGEGRFQGAVRMRQTGLVLNARLFAALLPEDALRLMPDGRADWQGRCWRVSRVPQRCWPHEGRLTTQASPTGEPALVSVEDISAIRRRVETERPRLPGAVTFRAVNELEDYPAPDDREDRARRRRPTQLREWRRDHADH